MQLVLEDINSLKHLVGQEIAVSDWFVVTQERIQNFAEITEDRQWIHVDTDRAQRKSPYGTTIAPGFLTLSLLSQFLRQAVEIRAGFRMGINYGLNRVRFPGPVRSGEKICARFTLQSIRELSSGLEAVYRVSVEAENVEKPCCVAEWVVRYYL